MKQESLFGRAVDLSTMKYEKRGRKTIKQAFRDVAGYNDKHTCADCKHHHAYKHCGSRKRIYHKCEKIGNSSCESTDIRLSDRACKFYESEGSEKNEKENERAGA